MTECSAPAAAPLMMYAPPVLGISTRLGTLMIDSPQRSIVMSPGRPPAATDLPHAYN